MNSKPLVTIIMAARNVEEYIVMAVDSVLAQTYDLWELIIIENDSDDGTSSLIQQYVDPRIKHISIHLPGLSNARNMGLDNANGEFICFLDADDRLPIDSLSDRLKYFAEHPEVSFVDGVVHTYSYNFSKRIRLWEPDFHGIPDREMALLVPRCFCGITWMIRKVAIGKTRFDTSWSHLEDRLFFLAIAEFGQYSYINNPVYDIRKRPGSLMTKHRKLEQGYTRFLMHVHEKKLLDPSSEYAEKKAFHLMFFRTYLKHFRFRQAMIQCLHLIRLKLF